jgi:hypothetical protein
MNIVGLRLGAVKVKAAVLAVAEEQTLPRILIINNGFDTAPVFRAEVKGGSSGKLSATGKSGTAEYVGCAWRDGAKKQAGDWGDVQKLTATEGGAGELYCAFFDENGRGLARGGTRLVFTSRSKDDLLQCVLGTSDERQHGGVMIWGHSTH